MPCISGQHYYDCLLACGRRQGFHKCLPQKSRINSGMPKCLHYYHSWQPACGRRQGFCEIIKKPLIISNIETWGLASHAVPLYFIRIVCSHYRVTAGPALPTQNTFLNGLRSFSKLLRGEFKALRNPPRTTRRLSAFPPVPTTPRQRISLVDNLS